MSERTVYRVYIDSKPFIRNGEIDAIYTAKVATITGNETPTGRLKVARTSESGFAAYLEKDEFFDSKEQAIFAYTAHVRKIAESATKRLEHARAQLSEALNLKP